jgi:hypothetical protein
MRHVISQRAHVDAPYTHLNQAIVNCSCKCNPRSSLHSITMKKKRVIYRDTNCLEVYLHELRSW